MTRVVVIEDDDDLAMGLRVNLEVEDIDVSTYPSGEAGLAAVIASPPDVVVLDLMLPGIDGFEVLRRLRAAGIETPVLLLSARAQEVDKVRGFRVGADDYVTKPFGVLELMLRIRALAKRAPTRVGSDESATITIGNVIIDMVNRTVRRDGKELPLSPRAFDLLKALYDSRDRVVSRYDLLRQVWRYDASVTTRTIDAHVVELRRKIERDQSKPRHILTVRNVGYRLRP
ncbi:MAG: response regulator transcription factor [Gemmatimonadota bacterium]|nr:response regulator transcription factor [Gemmatimonadota bacterium]